MSKLCIICGARTPGPKSDTCDRICSLANAGGITRERAQRIMEPVVYGPFPLRGVYDCGEKKLDRIEE